MPPPPSSSSICFVRSCLIRRKSSTSAMTMRSRIHFEFERVGSEEYVESISGHSGTTVAGQEDTDMNHVALMVLVAVPTYRAFFRPRTRRSAWDRAIPDDQQRSAPAAARRCAR